MKIPNNQSRNKIILPRAKAIRNPHSLVEMPEAEDNHQASWKYSLLSKETVLADTGKAGDMIRAMDSTSLTAGVNEYRASQFSWDAEGELTVNSYIVNGDTVYIARWPQENHVIRDIDEADELIVARYVGDKNYELKDHLGNVRVVISDRKNTIAEPESGGGPPPGGCEDPDDPDVWLCPMVVKGMEVEVVAYYNYYSFGALRTSYNPTSSRYGYNGKEKDDEIKGTGNSYDFGARIYDPRLGRWLSVDPRATAFESPYAGMNNNPVIMVDPDGEWAEVSVKRFGMKNGQEIQLKKVSFRKKVRKEIDVKIHNAKLVNISNFNATSQEMEYAAKRIEKEITENLNKTLPNSEENPTKEVSVNIQFVQDDGSTGIKVVSDLSEVKTEGNNPDDLFLITDSSKEPEVVGLNDQGRGLIILGAHDAYLDLARLKSEGNTGGENPRSTATHEFLHRVGSYDYAHSGGGFADVRGDTKGKASFKNLWRIGRLYSNEGYSEAVKGQETLQKKRKK